MRDFEDRIGRRLAAFLERSPFCQRLINRLLMNSTVVPAKLYPFDEGADVWWTEKRLAKVDATQPETLPIPPRELWEGYGRTPAEYVASGQRHVTAMLEILTRAGFAWGQATRVMDFGCSAGRMTRWLTPHAGEGREIWGVDIASPQIHWAGIHLSPPLHFVTTTTIPALPFAAETFDLIYCGSVFSHIADLADAWLLELRRLLRRGGFLYVTIHDKHSIELLLGKHADRALARSLRAAGERTACLTANFAKLVLARSPKGAQVFYDVDFLRTHWGRWLEIIHVAEEAYGYQTALVLRKS